MFDTVSSNWTTVLVKNKNTDLLSSNRTISVKNKKLSKSWSNGLALCVCVCVCSPITEQLIIQ